MDREKGAAVQFRSVLEIRAGIGLGPTWQRQFARAPCVRSGRSDGSRPSDGFHQIDATPAFDVRRVCSGAADEAWERHVAEPGMKIVDEFLYGERRLAAGNSARWSHSSNPSESSEEKWPSFWAGFDEWKVFWIFLTSQVVFFAKIMF